MIAIGRGLVVGLVALALAASCYPGADLVGARIKTQTVDAAPAWLHVAHPPGGVPYIADDQGRQVVLRGVLAAGLIDYWSGTDAAQLAPAPLFPIDPAAYENGRCPQNYATIRNPPLCRNDLAEMSRLVQLPVQDDGRHWTEASDDFRFAAAVAAFGQLLRDTPEKGLATWDKVLALARSAVSPRRGIDPNGPSRKR